jgi:hypothetical protein
MDVICHWQEWVSQSSKKSVVLRKECVVGVTKECGDIKIEKQKCVETGNKVGRAAIFNKLNFAGTQSQLAKLRFETNPPRRSCEASRDRIRLV